MNWMQLNAINNIRSCAIKMIGDVKSRLGPVTEIRKTTKGQVRHRLREQRKVPDSLLEGGVLLTKKC